MFINEKGMNPLNPLYTLNVILYTYLKLIFF